MANQIQLNHFFTDYCQPEKTCLAVMEENIASYSRKALACSVIEKICYIALLAIVATVFAISYNLLTLSGFGPAAVAGAILLSPVLLTGPAKLSQLSRYYSYLAENETKISLKMREIENWTSPQIEEFMRAKELNPGLPNRAALAQISPQAPMKALLPLIAKYMVMEDRIRTLDTNYNEAPWKLEQGFREKEAADGKEIPPAEKQKIRYESESLNWETLEMEAIPTAFNAATLLQIIENPTMTDLDVLPLSFVLPNVGTCVPRNYAERMFAKTTRTSGEQQIEGNDDYFVFHQDLHRPAIQHQEIIELNMRPELIRNRLLYLRANARRYICPF